SATAATTRASSSPATSRPGSSRTTRSRRSTRRASASSSASRSSGGAVPSPASSSASAASTAATPPPSRSATRSASTTSRARRSACPSPGWPPRRPPSAPAGDLRRPGVTRRRASDPRHGPGRDREEVEVDGEDEAGPEREGLEEGGAPALPVDAAEGEGEPHREREEDRDVVHRLAGGAAQHRARRERDEGEGEEVEREHGVGPERQAVAAVEQPQHEPVHDDEHEQPRREQPGDPVLDRRAEEVGAHPGLRLRGRPRPRPHYLRRDLGSDGVVLLDEEEEEEVDEEVELGRGEVALPAAGHEVGREEAGLEEEEVDGPEEPPVHAKELVEDVLEDVAGPEGPLVEGLLAAFAAVAAGEDGLALQAAVGLRFRRGHGGGGA